MKNDKNVGCSSCAQTTEMKCFFCFSLWFAEKCVTLQRIREMKDAI